jgi:hypothetical protein
LRTWEINIVFKKKQGFLEELSIFYKITCLPADRWFTTYGFTRILLDFLKYPDKLVCSLCSLTIWLFLRQLKINSEKYCEGRDELAQENWQF